ncbi:MAG: integrase [Sulfolobales archaeon]
MWFESLDLGRISEEDRRRVLLYAVSKLGRDRVRGLLGVSRVTMWRLEKGLTAVDDEKLVKLLSLVTQREFEEVLGAYRRLKVAGVIRDDGTVDYSAALEVLRAASYDEYLKQLVIRFVVENFREDVKKAVGVVPARVGLEWDEGFERFLREHKRRRKVSTDETVRYYRSLFKRYLEGRELSEELVDYVVSHENGWLRNVFRHYVQYLYYRRKIPLETFGWLMEVVPSRGYRAGVRVFEIDLELFEATLRHLKERHDLYYLYFLLMYYSGIRLEHVVKLVATFKPREVVYIPMLDRESPRLACFEKFCRYYLGLTGGKPCEFVYFPKELLDPLSEHSGELRESTTVSRYFTRHDLLRPKYLRKLNWRVLTRVVPDKDVCRFVQSRLGELRVSEARYGDLLREADRLYPKALEALRKGLEDSSYLAELLS